MPENPSSYPLQVGSAGQKRLALLNEIYNPLTQQFLIDSGLKSGMTVLEIGCGTGIMACWMAEQVGPSGKVIATDQSADQIAIAKQTAQQKNLTNIECMTLSVENIKQLTQKFDFIFSRWTLCFVTNPTSHLKPIYDALNPNGIIMIEDLSVGDLGCFVYPLNNVVDRWMTLWGKIFKATQKDPYFASSLYNDFAKLKLDALKVRFSQPALLNSRDKSVLPLAVVELREMAVNTNSETPQELDKLYADANKLTEELGILGFIRTILVSGRKTNV